MFPPIFIICCWQAAAKTMLLFPAHILVPEGRTWALRPDVASLRDISLWQLCHVSTTQRLLWKWHHRVATQRCGWSDCWLLCHSTKAAPENHSGKQGHLAEGCSRLLTAPAITKHLVYRTPTEGGRVQGSRGWEKEEWAKMRERHILPLFFISTARFSHRLPTETISGKRLLCSGQKNGQ